MKKLAVATVAIVTAIGSVFPAYAFPAVSAPTTAPHADIVQVRDDFHHGRDWRGGHRNFRHDRGRWYGHRDRHSNAGAIIGGLAAGAIIGGALASSSHPASHAQSCASRYRSYRASDNTWQPNIGPRVQCN